MHHASRNRYLSLALSSAFALAALGHSTLGQAEDAKTDTQTPEAAPSKGADSCELLSRGPGVTLQDSEVTLHSFLENFIADLRAEKFEGLAKYFDHRAKVKSDIGDKIKSIIDNRYNAPLQYSVFRVWRIRSPDESKQILDTCPDSDGAKIVSSFGYKKQFAVWIQIMGQNELGRLILSIAPEKEKIGIVGFRIQQATQSGDDWRTWATRGEEAESQKNLRQAYFAYDVAQKLIDGKDFVLYPTQNTLLNRRDAIYSQAKLVETVNADLGIHSTAYVGTLLAREGSGIFLREYIAKELPSSTLRELCFTRAHGLQKNGWLTSAQGIRCNFIFKGMDPTRDSQLGGYYLTPEDLKTVKR